MRGAHPGDVLMRHYRSNPTGVAVWKLANGTYTERQPDPDVEVAHLYHGGHIHPVTDEEAAALTAAGYGSCIT